MKTPSSIDRETFQQLLSSVFAVQESRIDSQSLATIMEMQRLIAIGKLDVDGAMHLIVEAAQNVANATGVAVGLIKGGQLVYRAGTGCAAANVGRQVAASLTAAANTKVSREILRVENALTDTRIEAAICRQFGAKSLLILPIYHEQILAGVLEILFNEPHVFQDREVRAYRLMAEQIEAAIAQGARSQPESVPNGTLPARQLIAKQTAAPRRESFARFYAVFLAFANMFYRRSKARLATEVAVLRDSWVKHSSWIVARFESGMNDPVWRRLVRNISVASAVVVLGFTSWLAYSSHVRASRLTSSARSLATSPSSPIESLARSRSPQPLPTPAVVPASVLTNVLTNDVPQKNNKAARARRGRSRRSETRDIGNDVTVRYFTYTSSPKPRRVSETRVDYIGSDVTVRYFIPQPAALPNNR